MVHARSGAAQVVALGVFLGLSFGAAAIGGAFTTRSVSEWYPRLAKPAWTPDPSVIGLAWTLLYPAIGVAGWLIWRAGPSRAAGLALSCWVAQMVLNAAWSGLFFGLRSPRAGILGIALLLVAIAATIWASSRVSPGAAWLFLPYLGWVCFAGALNVAIWRLNA
jgi:tryptophan-rich sensory protein